MSKCREHRDDTRRSMRRTMKKYKNSKENFIKKNMDNGNTGIWKGEGTEEARQEAS